MPMSWVGETAEESTEEKGRKDKWVEKKALVVVHITRDDLGIGKGWDDKGVVMIFGLMIKAIVVGMNTNQREGRLG